MSVPTTFNLIRQNQDLPLNEYLNKLQFDQTIPLQPTISYLDVFALMPTDNALAIAAGGDIAFPRTSASSNTDIVLTAPTQVTLGPIGTYQVTFVASLSAAAQLVLTLNNVELPNTVVGRASVNSQVNGTFIVTTAATNSVLTVRNPSASLVPITLTVSAGGADPVTAHLIVTRLR